MYSSVSYTTQEYTVTRNTKCMRYMYSQIHV